MFQVVVIGGNGYVGRRVLQSALINAADAVSVNRSGAPANLEESWVSQVKWVSGKLTKSLGRAEDGLPLNILERLPVCQYWACHRRSSHHLISCAVLPLNAP